MTYSAFFPTRKIGQWINQGSAIISRYPLHNKNQMKLPGFGEKRYLCSVDAMVDIQKITCYTTHLSTNSHVNIAQRYFIAKKLHTKKKPMILTGDFNIERDHLNIIKNNTCLNDINIGPTYPSWKPKSALDHIFVSDYHAIEKNMVYDKEHFSDHLPIGVHIERIKKS